MMQIYVGWNIFNHLKIFYFIYMCIIGVLNKWHMWVKNMHLWNNRFCANFKQPNEIPKFVSLMTYFIINKKLNMFIKEHEGCYTFNNMS